MGRHGGINILHQKSWHVWRLDNRLTVERDELRHAEEEREKRKAEEQQAFSSKVARLRRRAQGLSEEQEALSGVGLHRPHAGEGPSASSSSSAAPRAAPDEERAQSKGKGKTSQSFKYGMVTVSNLKRAEQDLDAMLKGRGGARDKGYWGTGGLGSGPHINLFEEAEIEMGQQLEEHQKQLRYTQRNNELAEKSKRRPLSEFDEIIANVPWYLRKPDNKESGTGDQSDEDETVAVATPTKTRRKERHGQVLLSVRSAPGLALPAALADEPATFSSGRASRSGSQSRGAEVAETIKDKMVKKEKKEKKIKKDKKITKEKKEDKVIRRDEKRLRAHEQVEALRRERQEREAKERARSSGLALCHSAR